MNSNLHPIFNALLEELSENEYTMMEKQKMSKLIAILPDDEIEMIYSFIICYSKLKNPNIGSHIIPYRGAPLKSLRGIQFHTSDIPLELQKIISLYLEKITR
jgi:hypothetical protein